MQRGILFLTKDESQLALELAQNSVQHVPSLVSKLQLAIEAQEAESTIEVTIEEVEVLLDALPIPSQISNPQYQVLRDKLQKFLANQ